jgi:hypothetical protein
VAESQRCLLVALPVGSCDRTFCPSKLPAFWVADTMLEDSIHKASSVEVVESSKRSHLRPLLIKGDSFFTERDEGRKLDDGFTRSRPSPSPRGATFLPDWAQDAENMPMPSGTEHDLGSPEDIKDVLRMGITQEMRVSPVEASFSKDMMLIRSV